MSTPALIASVGFVALVVFTLLFIAQSIGSAIRRRHTERRQVTGPDGVWSTRIHWAHPKAGLGVAERVFKSVPVTSDDKNNNKKDSNNDNQDNKGKKKRSGWWDLADLGDLFDEAFLIILGLLATVGLLLAGLVIVLLAIELAFFVLLFAILGSGRVLFRHPWTIEVIDPHGSKQLVAVEGLSETREAQLQIREQIAAGTLSLSPRSEAV